MNKQQFMAMSLPYGLKYIVNNQFGDKEIVEIDTISNEIIGGASRYFNKYKSILYPLSNLTKEIEHNGEKFIPTIIISKIMSNGDWLLICSKVNINNLPYYIVEKLIEWHFDIAGLIEKGEAIDVNTLPKNPYK